MINDRDIERILDRADIVDVISDYVQLKKKGSHYECCCPFHNEKTPSFKIDTRKNTWFCYGSCQEGGNAIRFLMRYKNLSFPEAVKDLAKKYNIEIEEDNEPHTHEDLQKSLKRDSMFTINQRVADFFVEAIHQQNDKAAFALGYSLNRWNKTFVQEMGIGYADDAWDSLYQWALLKGLSIDLMLEMGLLKKSKKNDKIYDFYRGRIVIPIRDRFRRVIGFTARDITGSDDTPKYLNSAVSPIYNKDNSIFGIDVAIKLGAKEELFYCVEGAPDALRLHSIGVTNTIAPLGAAWTANQLAQLKKFNPRLCFIPDIDVPKDGEPYGTGIKVAMENGMLALKQGFAVTVKEIIPTERSKVDPDSYITSKEILANIEEQDFIIWYAAKLFMGGDTTAERSEHINTIAKLVAQIDDDVKEAMYIKQLLSIYKDKKLWASAIGQARKQRKEKNSIKQSKTLDKDLYQKYGFYEDHNCYFSIGKDAEDRQWSNFTMEPLFHIKDAILPKRLYKIRNNSNIEEIIELKQEDLVSLSKFKQRVEGLGNYIWLAKEEHLTKLKMFLYEQTETAIEITQLGWQRKGFFAFGNGVYHNGTWHQADDFGIVRLDGIGNFYLPANSRIYRDETKLFQFERRFVHLTYSNISFRQYTDKLIEVFGDNAKVGIAFYIATLFRDVVTGVTKSFPILNLFGPKGSGKSELGHSLMSFFISENVPPNIQNSTEAALAETVAQCANALVHLDEYKNTIELTKREFLKGLWDGSGRTRMNMDRDKKRETTAVDSGIILSGQEMPTIDIALFSRLIYLTFNKSEFSHEAKKHFDELTEMRKLGCSHLTLNLLKHRALIEAEFSSNFRAALADILLAVENDGIEDRILRNWAIPLAVIRTLSGTLDLAFGYREMLKICINGIRKQNAECKSNNELANFWNVVNFLHQNGDIYIEGDYRIMYQTNFLGKGQKERIIFPRTKPVLYIRKTRIMMLYKKNGKLVGDTTLPTESLKYYLENSKEYLGIKQSMRFKNIINGLHQVETVETDSGFKHVTTTDTIDQAMCFDYEMLCDSFGINLEVQKSAPDEPEEIPNTQQVLSYE